MRNKIRDAYYNIKNGVSNLIKWTPTIWKDRDFDHFYFHEIMKQKLIHMEEFSRSKYAWGADSEKDADNMRIAINLLKRMTDSSAYDEESMKPFNDKYPDYEFKLEFKPCEDNPNLSTMVNDKTEEQSELVHQCYKVSEELEEKDYDELYSLLKKHIQEWWD